MDLKEKLLESQTEKQVLKPLRHAQRKTKKERCRLCVVRCPVSFPSDLSVVMDN